MNENNDGWVLAIARDREGADITPYTVRVREAPPKSIQPETFPYLLEITWAFFSTRAGQPEEADEERMDAFEELVEDNLSRMGEAALMASITGKGKRVWLWYVRDVETAERLFNDALAEEEPVPIEINILLDGKWAQYNKIRSSALNAATYTRRNKS